MLALGSSSLGAGRSLFSRLARSVQNLRASKDNNFKVCVCGGAGGIGQPLALLMALDSNVGEVLINDLEMALVPPAGVAADLGQIDTKAKVTQESAHK